MNSNSIKSQNVLKFNNFVKDFKYEPDFKDTGIHNNYYIPIIQDLTKITKIIVYDHKRCEFIYAIPISLPVTLQNCRY